MIDTILTTLQIILSIVLIITILLQARGSGLGAVFGGGGEVFRTKRGIEKGLFFTTIVVAFLFFAIAFVNVLF